MSTLRYKMISTQVDSLLLDSLSVVPGSISIAEADSGFYSMQYIKGIFRWNKKLQVDSVRIAYRVFPFSFSKPYAHKNLNVIENNIIITPYYYDAIEASKSDKTFIDFGNVDYAGSFGRALSFGNSQDIVLNSQFNLQLDGDLGDSIKLTGAITDNTIPFQPEGNTQQLQEFDKVFIQLKRKTTSLIVGDYDIKKPAGYFMSFYKRVQGGFFSTESVTSKNGRNKVGIGASLAKGKFVRNVLTSLEGNQGPYKLTGPNGEQFFVVLAGTERVYIDGILLSRGESQDYIIDYNTAEVTFMPRRIITKDLRIVVEFEFSDRNYLNSLLYLNDEWQVNKKLNIRFNAYSNQDAKSQSIQQSLDSSQKYFLSTIGDSIHQAFYPSVRYDDTFSNNKILYKKIDTVINSIVYNNVYVFSTNPDSAKYTVGFTYVGQGLGNYRQSVNSANGRVYQWVEPQLSIRQGDYEPITILVTPKKQQMFSAGATYKIDENKVLNVEAAMSNYDPNMFSKIDNNTHTGFATKVIYDEKRNLNTKKDLTLQTSVNYEFVQDRFRQMERFRNVEFARDWNVTTTEKPQNEHLGNVQFSLAKDNLGKFDYKFGTYFRGDIFKGTQHVASISANKKGYKAFLKGDLMQQSSLTSKGNFYRPFVDFQKQFTKLQQLTIGTKYLLEHNELKSATKDSLLKNAFSFDILTFYVKSNEQHDNNFGIEYIVRKDRAVKDNNFKQSTLGKTLALNATLASIQNHNLRLTGAYRTLEITDTTITALKPEESLLGRLEYNGNLFKGLLTGNILYELGSGQELKREFTYVQVPAGQGIYVWRDYNNDNLKQLNEFELAIFPDEKLYIKIFTPTNQYVKAKYSIYNQSIALNPKALLSQSDLKGLKKIASMFFIQSAVQLNNRFLGQQGLSQYNPFIKQFEDSLLINNSSSMINSIYINRFSNKWGVDYINTLNSGKTLLNYGVDSRRTKENQLRGRYNVTKNVTMLLSGKRGEKYFNSQFLESRSFVINYNVIEPGFNIVLLKNQFRIQSGYKYDVRLNEAKYGGEKASIHSVNVDLKYNIITSGSINIRTTFSEIQFNGVSNSTIGYTMLDGLQNGKNWLWGASFEKRISRNIEMSLEYEGRKPATSNVIHTGRASVRAIF